MKKILLVLIALSLAFTKLPPSAFIVTLTVSDGTCSAFCVNPNGTYFTAAHCLTGGAELDGKTVTVKLIDDQTDLGVFTAKGRPAMLLGKEPSVYDTVLSLGYGEIPGVLLQWPGAVFSKSVVPMDGIPPVLLYGGNLSPGMSGGPILNLSGKVVSVVSGGGSPTGSLRGLNGGVPYFAVEQAWRRYGVQQ